MGGLPFLDQPNNHVRYPARAYSQSRRAPDVQLDQPFATDEARSTDHVPRQQGVDEGNPTQVQPTIEYDHTMAQDEAPQDTTPQDAAPQDTTPQDAATQDATPRDEADQVQQVSTGLSTSQTPSKGSTSTVMRLTRARLLEISVQKPKPRAENILEPYDGPLEPEPHAAAEMPQSNVRRSLQPASRKWRRNSKPVSRHRSANKSAERNSDDEQERPKRKTTRWSQGMLVKPRRKSHMLRDLEPHNISPERESEQPKRRTTRSSQRVSAKPRRKSQMLREIEPHNLTPERESKPNRKTSIGSLDVPRTRGSRQVFQNIMEGKPEGDKINYNLRDMMITQFCGGPKRTKTFYPEDSVNLEPPSHQRQLKPRNKRNSWTNEDNDNVDDDEGEDEDEEKYMTGNGKINAQSHAQPKSVRQAMPRKGKDSNDKVATESVWSRGDRVSGQSSS